jgi:hypothetical protein
VAATPGDTDLKTDAGKSSTSARGGGQATPVSLPGVRPQETRWAVVPEADPSSLQLLRTLFRSGSES